MTISARKVVSPRAIAIALALGGTAAVAVGIAGSALSDSLSGGAAEHARAASRWLAAIAGASCGLAYLLARAGRRRAAAVLGGSVIIAALGWIAVVGSRAGRNAPLPLLASDRSGLAEIAGVDGQRWVAHPTLGFRLPQPVIALAPADALVRETASRAGPGWSETHQLWAFEAEDRGLSVTVDLSRAADVDRESLERRARAAAAPLRAQGIAAEVETVQPGAACAGARFGGALEGGGRVDTYGFAFRDPRTRRAFHLMVTIVGPERAGAREYLGAVEVPCEGIRVWSD